mmetsp:Transcript_27276/g.76984  ORF Transcript_27276/g.76984 Transcript_27276/m.76984 type:complete len:109 (+) Transcript_27276:1320-1646(+)
MGMVAGVLHNGRNPMQGVAYRLWKGPLPPNERFCRFNSYNETKQLNSKAAPLLQQDRQAITTAVCITYSNVSQMWEEVTKGMLVGCKGLWFPKLLMAPYEQRDMKLPP